MKLFKSMFITLTILCMIVGTSFAMGSAPPLQTAEATGVVYSQPLGELSTSHNPNGEDFAWNTGYTAHEFTVKAEGTKTAFVSAKGFSTVKPTGFAFQKEINGGELSGAFSKTTGFTTVKGFALGIDDGYSRCGGDAYAKVNLKVHGSLVQANGAYSDDRDSFAGAFNENQLDFEASSYDKDNKGWFAEADGRLSAGGSVEGGSLAWAKQTNRKATVFSITGNKGSVWFCGADKSKATMIGSGTAFGVAQLPNLGYVQYESTFNYEGSPSMYGVAYGTGTIQKVGQYGVKSSASSGAFVGNQGGEGQPQ